VIFSDRPWNPQPFEFHGDMFERFVDSFDPLLHSFIVANQFEHRRDVTPGYPGVSFRLLDGYASAGQCRNNKACRRAGHA
jgi:hypothetical protein